MLNDRPDEISVPLEVRGNLGGAEASDSCSCPRSIPCGFSPRLVSALGLNRFTSSLTSVPKILCKPARDHSAFIDMAGSLNNRLGLWLRKDVVEDIFRTLKDDGSSLRVVLADTDVDSFNSHLSKHCLLLRSIHMYAIFLKCIAELEV